MRNVYGGPWDGGLADAPDEPFAFIDSLGRCSDYPEEGRFPYRYVFGGWCFISSDEGYAELDDWVAVRAAAERGKQGSCGGCYLAPDPESGFALERCPLCGQAQQGQAA